MSLLNWSVETNSAIIIYAIYYSHSFVFSDCNVSVLRGVS